MAAVRSILKQRLPSGVSLEVLAVVDGPQPDVEAALEDIDDERVRVIRQPTRRGHSAARARGVIESRGDWIAFLDDDDRWMPTKLDEQLRAAERARGEGGSESIVGCRVRAVLDRGSMIWPEVLPGRNEPIDEYLYRRRGLAWLRTGRALVQTSMILAPASLLRRVNFRPGLRRHADPDWLLRAAREPGVRLVFPETDEPLAVWSLHDGDRVSAGGDWRYSIVWARRHADLMSPRAMAGFLTGPAAHRAGALTAGRERISAFTALLLHAWRLGKPSIWDCLALTLFFVDAGRWRPVRRGKEAGA